MKKFQELEYVRPDFDAVRAGMKKFAADFRKAASYEEMRNLILEQEKFISPFMTMCTIASVRNTMDMNDAFYEAEVNAINEFSGEISVLSKEVNAAILESPYKENIKKEFGPLMIQSMETSLKLASEAIIEDMAEEAKLCQEYSKTAATCSTTFRGEECNFYGLLKHMQSTDREERKEAFEAWAALYEKASAELDPQYEGLTKLRKGMAEKLGFANYIDMIYPQRGRYDYTKDDVAKFRKQVKDVIVPVCSRLYEEQRKRLGVDTLYYYDESLVYKEGNAVPNGTKDELVEKAQVMYHELSKETGEFFDFMKEHELFDLETKKGKHQGGYCTFLNDYKAPFIFSNFNGTSADVDVLTHEAGHAFEAYTASRVQPLSDMVFSTSEINEIHSMSMEHFTYPWMESFFGENADKYRYAHLASALQAIPYLVCVDEFQHRVFESGDLTAADRRAIWHELEETYMPWRNYDGNAFLEEGGFWMQKQHIFLYPFYYIDYALAQMGAFEFYAKMCEDKEAAFADYYKLCKAGGSMGYFDTLRYAGLSNPFEEGTVKKIVDFVESKLF
ncbi:MAG: M3 family oligoendopeptidase [Lachnospiraceae bacterium]|nr:M3 family oligoendopeptidase [Lachnospiraceae bacterium]